MARAMAGRPLCLPMLCWVLLVNRRCARPRQTRFPACLPACLPACSEKIVQGRVDKIAKTMALLEQPYIKDSGKTVAGARCCARLG